MTKIMALMIVAGLAACAGRTGTQTLAPSSAPVLGIAELKFFLGDDIVVHLGRDGALSARSWSGDQGVVSDTWTAQGSLTADALLTSTSGGPAGQLTPDGTFKANDGTVADFRLVGETLVVGGKRVTLDSDGLVLVNGQVASRMRVEGASDPSCRRTALLVMAIALLGPAHPIALATR
jgi:hypothetical protein